MRNIILLVIVLMLSFSCKKDTKHELIRVAVENQLSIYPKSTLQDLYKNFFQDYFGPGHMVNDTASAGAYLDRELASFEQAPGAYYEPTGYNGNFYRVNLSVIKEGLISRDVFFDAFIRSVSNIQTISIEEWEREWMLIDSVIQAMNLVLPNYEQDREMLFSLLEQGKYVVHHSEVFSEAYDPHYRIINRDIFLKEILSNL
ncbi:hypothetical protein M2459_000658 [Parabacteroides sp. PF5-5]|uniref:hypothetical protein n=1 Tax=unclassified Parabacteroides TaxID=2649774 RepID=UPI002474E00E|nr:MULTISPECIES: hypothetical protein [unclassified Parabacteroides]MDH6303408.1 hypothetical protein [Parabacteroides sp. PH5-39]MDH6314731.1 hypothetical protein [Parabacteroides sp. PF5-13]MDH6318068.1 hypothetical protein [Parabacteroides sp. PH5-13]MDH6322001.1 hypothetical protein [Parabacteroides sp. PH5-8]MDH6326124.1 hypothetical protein [Parabacteroides sp. PH5-41]